MDSKPFDDINGIRQITVTAFAENLVFLFALNRITFLAGMECSKAKASVTFEGRCTTPNCEYLLSKDNILTVRNCSQLW